MKRASSFCPPFGSLRGRPLPRHNPLNEPARKTGYGRDSYNRRSAEGKSLASRRCFASLAALCLVVAAAAHAQDLPALIARVAPAVVVLSEDGAPRGSGFVVSADGAVVTNLHVIARMRQPRVTLADGRAFDQVSVIGYDKERD